MNDMVRRCLEQGIKDRSFDARRDDSGSRSYCFKKEMANVALARENKETALCGSLKDNVATSGTMKIGKGRATGGNPNTILPETRTDLLETAKATKGKN